MAESDDSPSKAILEHVLVPIAHEEDARRTARALEPYQPTQVTAVHVIEKGEGVPDKTSVKYSKEVAAEAYEAVHAVFPGAETHTAYARNVVDEIFSVADEVGASAIAFHPQGGNRLLQFLSGDRSLKLVTQADRPVIALPHPERNS